MRRTRRSVRPGAEQASAHDPGVPGCDAGPAGRIQFVLREAAAALSGRRATRARARLRSADRTDDDSTDDDRAAQRSTDRDPSGGTR